ncbi:MAG: LytTR family DNA-binding domain-containing protein [Prolixibacteraceae bacterium]|jgi:two-component system, LytTR family, response regulator LytT
MNCIVIEDEPAAQSILQHFISMNAGLKLGGIFPDAFSAQAYLDQNKVDLMFLDINLPEMSGVSFLRSLVHPPLVIFTTAYSQYAIEGFDLEIVDFLLKPFSFERFSKAVNKAREKMNNRGVSFVSNRITVKSDRRIYQISIDDILFVEACGDYVSIFCTDKKLVVHGTLKSWEEKLNGFAFLKVHRTILVSLAKINHIEGNLIHIGTHKVPVSETSRQNLVDQMMRQPPL